MKELFADLTSSLPDDHPDKQCLGESYEDIAKRWSTLADRLNEREPQLGKLATDAQTHESDYGHLCDWLGPAEETAAAMATVPSELEAVQEQLKALEVCELFSSFSATYRVNKSLSTFPLLLRMSFISITCPCTTYLKHMSVIFLASLLRAIPSLPPLPPNGWH